MAQLLLEAGADTNAADKHVVNALMHAACDGQLEVVRLLLEAGTDKNAADTDGATALMAATFNDHLEVGSASMVIMHHSNGNQCNQRKQRN